MKITELSTPKLLKLLRVSEQSPRPDKHALSVLRAELSRRLGIRPEEMPV